MSLEKDDFVREVLTRWRNSESGNEGPLNTTVRAHRVGLHSGHAEGQQAHGRDVGDTSYRHMNGDLSASSSYAPKVGEEDDLKLSIDGIDDSFTSRDEQQPSSSSAISAQVDPQLEARVYARIKELRSNGLWSETRLPMCRDPGTTQRKKSHWDFLLEEVVWMHRDFQQERRLKRLAARKLASEARRRYRQRQEESEEDKRKAAEREGKRLAGQIAAKVKEFWRQVDRVVDLRAREILDSHRQRAREQQLALLVDDVGKLGTLLHDDLGNTTTDDELPIASSSEMDSKEVRRQRMNKIAEEAMGFQPKGFTLDTTQVRTPVPFLLRGTLREYQHVALDWLVTLYDKNLNGILADEMGLGKTIMAIALMAHLACERNVWGTHLIIVPTTVILNWEMELKRWCPGFKILTYFGSIKERREKRKGWSKEGAFHVCITSYKIFVQDAIILKRRKWQYLILDEAQNIKNFKSQRWQALLMVRSRRRLLLTGTPLQNNLMELWSLLHFLMPTVFASDEDFRDWFSNPLTSMVEENIEVNRPLVERLHKVLRPFILRRLKHDVEKQLPTKQEVIVPCPLSKRQRYLYSEFLSRRSTKENLQSGNMFSVLNIIMQLRKCCNHPNLFEARQVSSPFVHPSIGLHFPRAVLLPASISTAKCPLLSVGLVGSEVEWSLFKHAGPIDSWKGGPPTASSTALEGFRLSVDRNFVATSAYSANNLSPKMSLRNCGKRNLTTANDEPVHADRINGSDEAQPPAKMAKIEVGVETPVIDQYQRRVEMRSAERRRSALDLVHLHLLKGPPVLPLELVSVVNFTRKACGDHPCHPMLKSPSSSSLDQLGAVISNNMNSWAEDVIRSFVNYVEKVLLYGNPFIGLSIGTHGKFESEAMEDTLAAIESQMPATAYKAKLGRLLQFPETRLIEYDCGKLQILSNLLAKLYENKHRCLIFTQMTKMLDILQAFLAHHNYRYFRLDGSTSVEQRQAMMDRFNADSSVFVFILSTRAGGVGINLTGADTVIFYDSDWNPTMDAQAQDRCHRIGQTRNVTIYRLISEKTIEENILKKAMQKRRLGEMAIDEATFTPDFFRKTENIRELLSDEDGGSAVLVEELATTTSTAALVMSDEDAERVMTRVEDEMDVAAVKKAEAEVKRATEEEFDERIAPPAPSLFVQRERDSPVDQYAELISSMKPIERYALKMLEEKYRPNLEEQRREAEALIEAKRQQHLQLNAMESDDGADKPEEEEITYDVQKVPPLMPQPAQQSSRPPPPKRVPNTRRSCRPVVLVAQSGIRTRSSARQGKEGAEGAR